MRLSLAALPALLAVFAAGEALAQERVQGHMEGCLVWHKQDPVGVRNECSRPISLQLMSFVDGKIVTSELSPGGKFVWERQGPPGGFMFTACAAGLKPNVPFAIENKQPIVLSLYNCVGTEPTS